MHHSYGCRWKRHEDRRLLSRSMSKLSAGMVYFHSLPARPPAQEVKDAHGA